MNKFVQMKSPTMPASTRQRVIATIGWLIVWAFLLAPSLRGVRALLKQQLEQAMLHVRHTAKRIRSKVFPRSS